MFFVLLPSCRWSRPSNWESLACFCVCQLRIKYGVIPSSTIQNHTLCAHNILSSILHYTPKALYHAIPYYFPCSPEHPPIGRYVDSLLDENEGHLIPIFCWRLYVLLCYVIFVLSRYTYYLYFYRNLRRIQDDPPPPFVR